MHLDFDTAFESIPLGSYVSFSDGTKRPPEAHRLKLREWEARNDRGRLVARSTEDGIVRAKMHFAMGDIADRTIRVTQIVGKGDPTDRFELISAPKPGEYMVSSHGPFGRVEYIGGDEVEARRCLEGGSGRTFEKIASQA
jgi:hypothetical protein